jgi:hypothetical protein
MDDRSSMWIFFDINEMTQIYIQIYNYIDQRNFKICNVELNVKNKIKNQKNEFRLAILIRMVYVPIVTNHEAR